MTFDSKQDKEVCIRMLENAQITGRDADIFVQLRKTLESGTVVVPESK